MTLPLVKYPRTRHVQGSRLQEGDFDLAPWAWEELADQELVVEEKLDGANAALGFDASGQLLLQSRGHFLRGGPRERQFALFKTWGHAHQAAFREVLGARYVVYGEWLYAKHTIFYDALPHYFLEFDVYDRQQERFLSTPRRRQLLAGLPLVSAPLLFAGRVDSLAALEAWVAPARFKSAAWEAALESLCAREGYPPAQAQRETDPSPLSEGLYLKWEDGEQVLGRCKFVRRSFLSAVADSGSHWVERPILPNQLAPGVDLFAGAP